MEGETGWRYAEVDRVFARVEELARVDVVGGAVWELGNVGRVCRLTVVCLRLSLSGLDGIDGERAVVVVHGRGKGEGQREGISRLPNIKLAEGDACRH